MKKLGVLLLSFSLFCLWSLPVMAADTSKEVQQLKKEVEKLLQRIEDLEKKQAETTTKVADAEKKAEKAEKKSLKDRVNFSGEARFRIMHENSEADRNFYGAGQPGSDRKWRDDTSFPLRLRLNAHAEVVQDWVDVYARLTMNKRWGAWDSSATDPFNKPNSFESSIGHDMNARFEQMYMTFKLPWINSTWYLGRLPGMDGAPQRQSRTLFPRLFIDSEIDGTLLAWNAPETGLDSVALPWMSTRLWGKQSEPGKAPTLKTYESKVKDKTGIILGYLKYDEYKLVNTDNKQVQADSDAFLAQAQVKVGKDTEVILSGLTMQDWHMPNTSKRTYVPDMNTDYVLAGAYVDTQLLGLQVFGAYYYSHFDIPGHSFQRGGTGDAVTVEGKGYPGHIWFAGFNTGDLISTTMQLSVEFADGSDAWINPFNYRGFRRKGTVLSPAGNYFYDSSGQSTVGFYPFNAQVWDIYYDYYFKPNVRFRLGYIDFLYGRHERDSGEHFSALGSSKYQHDYWPYFEVNLSF
ncbi:MAG: DUF3373 family protein [Thermodesulfovibrionales bacterium]|nr:DUF3373 family protein [Thermodesulfovibrionales bacterium]